MDSKERSSPRHWRVEGILGHLNDNVDKNNAEELLHCILASTDILTWYLQGEIVYPNCTRCHCMICDFRLSEGNVTHVIASCSYCHCDEIMDVSTDKNFF